MANQNFRVKKGLEVGLGATYLFADDTGVGINSNAPRYNLDVNGIANIETGLQVGGPTTAFAGIGSTTFQVKGDSYFDGNVFVTGDLEFDDAVIDDLIVTGIASINGLGFKTGIGNTLTITDDLYVTGLTSLSNTIVDGVLGVTSSVGIARTLFVGGDVVVGGGITFEGNVTIEVNVELEGNINQNSGIATFDNLNFNVGIGSTLTVDDLTINNDVNVNGAGIATIGGDVLFNDLTVLGVSTFGGIDTTGISTFYHNLQVDGDVTVGGNIELLDLDAGNITVGGTIFTNGLEYNVGVGTTAIIGFASITDATVGLATLGELSVTGVSTFGGLNTTGFSTFYQNLEVTENLKVGGDIELSDLDSGNISVGGTVTTNGLIYNVGVGTTAIIGFASITDATVAIATISELNVTGFATFGGLNTTGFSTFYQNLEVTGDLRVGGDINLEDLQADSISIANTTTTNELVFNVGIGTSLTVTGISSLNIITGIGSELQYLPAGSISTSVGIGSTIPPSIRPTGEPVQPGDLWFDSLGLRQYTYYVGVGTTAGVWLDSNPPPIQPALSFEGDFGPLSQLDIQDDVFKIAGFSSEIFTQTPGVGFGQTIYIGLTTDVHIKGTLDVNEAVRSENAVFTGIATVGVISATSAEIDSIVIGDITVGEVSVGEIGINTLRFNVGVGTTLTVTDLTVTGNADIQGAGIATEGGDVTFNSLQVIGISTLGFTTITQDLYVNGNVTVDGDLSLDEVTLRNLNVSGVSTLQSVGFTTAEGTSLDLTSYASIGSTLGVAGQADFGDRVNIAGVASVAGFSTFSSDVFVGGKLDVVGDINVDEITARNITVTDILGSNLTFNYSVGSGSTFTAVDLTASSAGINTLGVSSNLNVTGLSSFTDTIEFGEAVGYALTVDRLVVPPTGFVDLPGIPVVGGAASFSQLNVTGIASFLGFTTITGDVFVSGAMTVGSLDAAEINFSGGTGIGSENISTKDLEVTGVTTLAKLIVNGDSEFRNDINQTSGIATFPQLRSTHIDTETLNVSIAATVGTLTATDAVMENLVITGNLSGSEGGAIIIDGDGNITGIVTIGENSITLDGRKGREYIEIGTGSGDIIAGVNTFTGEPSYVSVSEGRFNNNITVSGVSSTSTFAGDVNVEGQLTVGGDITFDGEVVGVATFQNLEVTDTATVGFITAQNASVVGIITAQDFNSLSDRRVKENIEPIADPLGKVAKLNGVTYQFVNSGKPSVGVIAQEVEKVFPELIAGTFPKSVNYNGLTGLLIEAVKELKKQNEELKRRLDKLEG